jgi:hypothetical protein
VACGLLRCAFLANHIADELIELDSRLDPDEDTISTHIHGTQSGGQPDDDALGVETAFAVSNEPADQLRRSINTVGINSSPSCDEQVRLASPSEAPESGLSTPPHSCNRDGRRSMTDVESDSEGLQYGTNLLIKRHKLSVFQGVETTLDKHNGRSPSVISDVDNITSLENLSDDNIASNVDVPTLTMSDSARRAPQIYPQLEDINQEWEYRKIIGEEIVNRVPCYLMAWCPTLIPKSSVTNQEVVAEYKAHRARARKAQAQARCEDKGKQRVRPDSKHSSRSWQDANAAAAQPQKRLKGRPQKVIPPTVR